NDAAKFSDIWVRPKQGTDSALGMALGHVILKEFYVDKQIPYFTDYAKQYTDLPFLVKLEKNGERWVAGEMLKASDFSDTLGINKHANWRPILLTRDGETVIPN
ncbi:MAG: hypothetical protein ACRCX1_06005, partial [Bacteroidales bacterium]